MKNDWLPLIILICIGLGCASANNGSNRSQNATPTSVETTPANSTNTVGNVDQASCIGTKTTKDVENALSNLGFNFTSIGTGGTLREAVATVDGEEVKVVLIFGDKNLLEDVRVQSFREMTGRKRRSIEKVADSILSSIQCGNLPKEFLAKFRKGMQVSSDDKVFNGFVYLKALQKPTGSKDMDRISLDIGFEDTPSL